MSNILHINESTVRELLTWDSVISAVEMALVCVSERHAVQNPRTFTRILGGEDVLLCMPGYLENKNTRKGTLACKMVTAFQGNEKKDPPLPTILANIFLFDEQTGQLKCIIEAVEITAWRTAAASVVATKHLHISEPQKKSDILAILGAGTQGRIHAIAFHHAFKFKQIRIWNHRLEKAEKLVQELKDLGIPAEVASTAQECVAAADVIITATFASSPILELDWVKSNVHINAVGAGTNHHSELSPDIYRVATIYVDDMEGAKVELAGLEEMGVELAADVGDVILGRYEVKSGITIFHSLGMAAEDAVVGQLIYDRYMSQQSSN